MSNHSIGFLLYDISEKNRFPCFFWKDLHVFGVVNGKSFQTKREQQNKLRLACILRGG